MAGHDREQDQEQYDLAAARHPTVLYVTAVDLDLRWPWPMVTTELPDPDPREG